MQIIEIAAQENGAHRNQIGTFRNGVPDGWAMIPDGFKIPDTFPFVEIEVKGGIVTSMTAGVVPEPEPQPDPEPTLEERVKTMETGKAEQTEVDELNEALNMILTGYTGEEAADEAGTA